MLPSLIEVEEAREPDARPARRFRGPNRCRVADAIGRALSRRRGRAARTLPPWDNSAMDGYAVRSADVPRTPVTLRVVETICRGPAADARGSARESAVRIMTGAPMPPGADAVVMQEKARASGDEVEMLEAAAPAPERARPRRGRARGRAAAREGDAARHPRGGAALGPGDDPRAGSPAAAGGDRRHRRRAVRPNEEPLGDGIVDTNSPVARGGGRAGRRQGHPARHRSRRPGRGRCACARRSTARRGAHERGRSRSASTTR